MKNFYLLLTSLLAISVVCSAQQSSFNHVERGFPDIPEPFVHQFLEKGIHAKFRSQSKGNKKQVLTQNNAKSGDEVLYRLDSLVYFDELNSELMLRRIFLYDENGNLSNDLNQFWDGGSNNWVNSYKLESTFNNNAQPLEVIYFEWDDFENNWIPIDRTVSAYDANNNRLQSIQYIWNDDLFEWIPSFKIEMTYNANNQMTLSENFVWESASTSWLPQSKAALTYNAEGNVQERISSTWQTEPGIWQFVVRNLFVYNEAGLITILTAQSWNNSTVAWVNSNKTEYFYNDDDQQIQQVSFNFSTGINDWMQLFKVDIEYNELGMETGQIIFMWSQSQQDWAPLFKNEETFSAEGNRDSEKRYEWNFSEEMWVLVVDASFQYEIGIDIAVVLMPRDLDELNIDFNNMILSSSLTFFEEGEILFEQSVVYHYSQVEALSVKKYETQNPFCYPNPAVDVVNFKLPEGYSPIVIELYDMTGRKVLQEQYTGQIQLSVGHLKPGIYIYNLGSTSGTFSGKIIKN